MAAVGFAGLLVLILRGDEVRGILTDLVRRALTVANVPESCGGSIFALPA